MIPRILYATAANLSVQGAALSDAVSCVVTEVRNDAYTLAMTYPQTGRNADMIELRAIIMAKPNPTDNPQPFRISKINAASGGLIQINADHICYDLSGIVCEPFEAGSAAAAMQALVDSAVPSNPFTFQTDSSESGDMSVLIPQSARALMGGIEGSVLDTYGGEWQYDGMTCYLRSARGENRGVSIRYGKNLQTLEQEKNCASCYTAVYPYWKNDAGELVTLTEKTVACPGTYDYTKILPLDLSEKFEEMPSETQLRNAASSYIIDNRIGMPEVSLKVSFIQLEQTEEFKDRALLERVSLCDTVTVEFPRLQVNVTAKVVKTVYDAILERYNSVEIGSYRSNIAGTIATVKKQVKALETTPPAPYREAVDRATQLITGNLGGYVVNGYDSNGDGYPDENLVMNTTDIQTATKVWRQNLSGLGYSDNGYNGPYRLALTMDGHFNADFIDTGTLTANVIKAGIIRALAGNTSWDLESGDLHIENADLVLSGVKTWDHSQYTQNDYQRAMDISVGIVVPTEADYEKLDINGDGRIFANDASRILQMIEQSKDLHYHWKVYINPSSREKAIRITQAVQIGSGTISEETELLTIGTRGISGGTYTGDVNGNVIATSIDLRGQLTGTPGALVTAGRSLNGGKAGFIAQDVTLTFDVENPSGWLVCVSTSTGTRHGLWYVYTTGNSANNVYYDTLVTPASGVEFTAGIGNFSVKNTAQYNLQYQISRLY